MCTISFEKIKTYLKKQRDMKFNSTVNNEDHKKLR